MDVRAVEMAVTAAMMWMCGFDAGNIKDKGIPPDQISWSWSWQGCYNCFRSCWEWSVSSDFHSTNIQ